MYAMIQQQEQCESCAKAREIENARLAWRDLYNRRNPQRAAMSFLQLAAYGAVHYDSRVLCYICQEAKLRSRPVNGQ